MTRALEQELGVAPLILGFRGVQRCTKLSRSTVYSRVAGGTFLKPVQLGAHAVGWTEVEVDAWIRHGSPHDVTRRDVGPAGSSA